MLQFSLEVCGDFLGRLLFFVICLSLRLSSCSTIQFCSAVLGFKGVNVFGSDSGGVELTPFFLSLCAAGQAQ